MQYCACSNKFGHFRQVCDFLSELLMPCSCCRKFARDSNEIRQDQSDSHRHLSLDVIDVDLIAFMGRFDHDLTSRLETYG